MKMVFPHARVSRSFGELASDMNSLVDSLFSAANGSAADPTSFAPRMDVHELSDKYVVALDVPGVKPEAIDIDVKDDELVIQGSRSSAVESKDEGFYRVERWAGRVPTSTQTASYRRPGKHRGRVQRRCFAADFAKVKGESGS